MPGEIKRIGVLTGGGDCPGLNAVIRAVVKTAIREHGWEIIGIEDGFEGLILPNKTRGLTYESVRGILPRGGTILGSTNRANPFAYFDRKKEPNKPQDVSDHVIQRVHQQEMDAVVVIGGDGTMHITHELIQKGLTAVGIPKTIDNDIYGTNYSIGFDTAVNTAMDALDRLHTTAESHHRIMVLEVMGRNSGWIALEAGISGGADAILIPEIPYYLDNVAAKIQERNQRNTKFSLVVVAEGARPAGGEQLYQEGQEIGGAPRLGGIGRKVANDLQECCAVEARVLVLGHLQRGGSPTAFDRLLATQFGNMAVQLIAERKFSSMVALRDDRIVQLPIDESVARQRSVPLDNDRISSAMSLGISLGATRDDNQQILMDH